MQKIFDRWKHWRHLNTESHILPLVNLIPICRGQEHVGDVRSKVDLEIKFLYCNFARSEIEMWRVKTLLLVEIASIFLSSRNSGVRSRRFASACFWIWREDKLVITRWVSFFRQKITRGREGDLLQWGAHSEGYHLVELGISLCVFLGKVDGVRDLLHSRKALLLQDILLIPEQHRI